MSGARIFYAALLLASGCGGVSADPGLEALLRVDGAQYVPGALPGDSGGPTITSLDPVINRVRAGEVDHPLRGTLSRGATALLVGLQDDAGHWIVRARPPAVTLPDQPTFDERLAFSLALDLRAARLVAAAVDAAGRVGAQQALTLDNAGPDVPDGELVISLVWDRDADLDLRVVTPAGVEIWSRNPSSAQPAGVGRPPSEAELRAAGALDADSNGQCVIDGRRRENVVWREPPPAGRYRVLVDTFSMCDERAARWRVDVRRAGRIVASAEGASSAIDTRFGHDAAAGVLALEFSP